MRTLVAISIVVLLMAAACVFLRRSGRVSTPTHNDSQQPPAVSVKPAKAGPDYAYPNPDVTPGAVDPSVTQENIRSTICVPGYTKTVRPPERVTHRLKIQLMLVYGRNGDASDYELDHFIPLELGGCPDCSANLWPEPFNEEFGAQKKNRVENYLHRQVCSGDITLKQAQDAIATDWVKVYEAAQ